MALNKVTVGGQMYQFLNDYPAVGANHGFTWNPIKGKCPHQCSYCFVKRYYDDQHPQPALHLDEKELKTDLGQGNYIFVGSSCDMWAGENDHLWVVRVLEHCRNYPNNKYLFQTKNPEGFPGWQFPPNTILGITLESNRCSCDFSPNAPCTSERYLAFKQILLPKMISVEPIMDFDLDIFVNWIREIHPEFVSIGADSKGHHLPEPPAAKIKALISALQAFTQVKVKKNLKRLQEVN